MTLLDRINKFPPCLCRLVARQRKRLLSLSEIAARSGLDRSTIAKLSHAKSWDHVTLSTLTAYCAGCGVNLLRLKPHLRYLRTAKKVALQKKVSYTRTLLIDK